MFVDVLRFLPIKGAVAMAQQGDFGSLALKLGQIFKTTPIKRGDMFQGRVTQVREVVDAINLPGKHVVIYGEAGVGKTSLGQILKTKLKEVAPNPIISALVNCDSGDDYSSIWSKMFEALDDEYPDVSGMANNAQESDEEKEEDLEQGSGTLVVIGDAAPPSLTPRDVRKRLEPLADHGVVYVILDEFDTIKNPGVRRLMADTIKLFSDREVQVTIILIGVAENISGLIEDHHSIGRCLREVHVPRMPFKELVEIVKTGLSQVGMTVKEDALEEIAGLSRGLPHYTHSLSLNAGRCALDDKRLEVSKQDVTSAVKLAVGQTNESIRHKYNEATYSPKKKTLHRAVLLACSLADCDEFGYFQPGDVTEQLKVIEGKEFTTDRFFTHLQKFCELDILRKTGGEYKWRYQFSNPLMQPYVIMKGLEERIIDRTQLNFFEKKYPLLVKR